MDTVIFRIPRESLLLCPTFLGSLFWLSIWVRLGEFLRLGDALRLGDGCGALRLSSVGLKWGLRARKVGGEFVGACIRGGVDGAVVLRDEPRGGVDRGFGLVPFQVKGCVPSCFIRCDQ